MVGGLYYLMSFLMTIDGANLPDMGLVHKQWRGMLPELHLGCSSLLL